MDFGRRYWQLEQACSILHGHLTAGHLEMLAYNGQCRNEGRTQVLAIGTGLKDPSGSFPHYS